MKTSEIDKQIKQLNKASNAYMKANNYAMAMYLLEERCELQRKRQKILNCA